MRYPMLAALVLGLLSAASPSRAEPPAGIVIAINGETDPKVAALQEIPVGTPVTLPPGTKLTFLHYASCKLVAVSGGTLTLSQASYKIDGKIESEKNDPCPLVYALAGAGSAPHWPVNPEFIFSGKRAGAVTAAAIFAEGKLDTPVLSLNLAGWRASPPADAPRMAADRRYVLRLTMRDVTQSIDVPFVATAATGPAPLVVVRMD